MKHRSAMGSALRYFRWYAPEKLERSAEELMRWYAEGKLKPLVSEIFPLEQSATAIRRLTERQALGKVVVQVAE